MTQVTLSALRQDAGRWWIRLAAIDARYLISFLITLVLVAGELRYSILGGYDRLVTALGCTMATEAALSRLVRGRVVNLQSAYITGISLALLIKPQAALLWPFALGGFIAIASKYVLQYRGRHLWNPSNFAISLLLLVAHDNVAILSHQWGNDLGTNLVIWCFGLAIALRVGVLHVTLTYVASFLVLAMVRNVLVGGPVLAELAPITGPMYQLFIFFMITDPRTTAGTPRGRMAVAALVAAVETGIRLAADYHIGVLRPLYPSPPILALAIVGPAAMWWALYRGRSASPSHSRVHSSTPTFETGKTSNA
ncbi:MAG: RnfABCDGE type electron transport complex subunit D [Gemmatimonadetes bacterium]|nr:RnfABCDGE type electron transport complex subunit D [Gemmatimonadota bacterium]